jgi:predicted metal-dependent HD superfamily phosphohydrolase
MGPGEQEALHAGWTRLLAALGCPAAAGEEAFADLAARYAEAGRHYHTLDHIADVLEIVRTLGASDQTPALLLAVWFHDAVYDSRAGDNEARSAALARAVLRPLGVPEAILAETEQLILLTRAHETAADDRSGQVLIDADLAVLGAPAPVYDAYARAIRQEYAWVAEAEYRAGRRGVLERFLRRSRIYATEEMFAQAEMAARDNLRREIAALS